VTDTSLAPVSSQSARPLPDPLDDSQSGTPLRRPGSARRTSSLDMVWPDGIGTALHLVGRGRDLVTTRAGDSVVVDAAEMHAVVDMERRITAIDATPPRPGIEKLVGAQGGTYLRSAIDDALPGEREAATPLHMLLDDIAGTSLIAGFVWTRHMDPEELAARRQQAPQGFGQRKGKIICSGLRPGGTAQQAFAGETESAHAIRTAGPLVTDDDALAWHEFPARPVVSMRRHRRVDVTPVDGVLEIDSFFRDSYWEPDGTEMALHEYNVVARVDATEHTLLDVKATPRVLPFLECQWAPEHVVLLIGRPVQSFRTDVQTTLTELQACTHLNDMMRCLTEVPSLAAAVAAHA
jgi:hypothetical protein